MSNTLDLRNPRNLRGLDKDLRRVVALADEMGWTGRRNGGGGILLSPPVNAVEGTKPVHVPTGKQDTTLYKKLARLVMRANPETVEEMVNEGVAALEATDKPVVHTAMWRHNDVVVGALTEGAAFGVKPGDLIDEQPEPTPEPAPSARTLVSEKPWLARVSSNPAGKTTSLYASDSVLERTWSDGSVDYLCPVCREYTSTTARSVSSHAGRHTERGEKQRTVKPEVVVIDAPIDGPNVQRIAGLAREIAAAMRSVDQDGLSVKEFSEALARHIIENRSDRAPREESGPLTPEQMVAKIKAVVMGDHLTKERDLEQQVADLSEKVKAAEKAAQESAAQVVSLRGTLATLSELAREV